MTVGTMNMSGVNRKNLASLLNTILPSLPRAVTTHLQTDYSISAVCSMTDNSSCYAGAQVPILETLGYHTVKTRSLYLTWP